MTLWFGGRAIQRVAVIDDERSVREAFGLSVQELELTPVSFEGPFNDFERFIAETRFEADAAVCDYHLRKRIYATFDGARAVAAYTKQRFPAILCTRYDRASVDEFRVHRQHIPVLMNPGDLSPTTLQEGFRHCMEEIEGVFRPSRKPWRTLVRIDDVDQGPSPASCYVVVPAWKPDEVIPLRLEHLPADISEGIRNFSRLYARVNIGAECQEELYFSEWQLA